MKEHIKTFLKSCILLITLMGSLRLYYNKQIGDKIDEYNNIPVYFNNIPFTTQGQTHAPDGYVFGKKYENIEFVKRYYFEVFNKKINIRDVDYENLKDNEKVGDLTFNKDFKNIKEGDIVILKNILNQDYFAIVTSAKNGEINIIRQNFFKMTRASIKDKDIIGILSI